jgi:hypothetical protein
MGMGRAAGGRKVRDGDHGPAPQLFRARMRTVHTVPGCSAARAHEGLGPHGIVAEAVSRSAASADGWKRTRPTLLPPEPPRREDADAAGEALTAAAIAAATAATEEDEDEWARGEGDGEAADAASSSAAAAKKRSVAGTDESAPGVAAPTKTPSS